MDPGLGYLFAAFLVTWLGLLLYVFSIGGRLNAIRRELDALEARNGEEQRSPEPPR
jgi:CcmD family protein